MLLLCNHFFFFFLFSSPVMFWLKPPLQQSRGKGFPACQPWCPALADAVSVARGEILLKEILSKTHSLNNVQYLHLSKCNPIFLARSHEPLPVTEQTWAIPSVPQVSQTHLVTFSSMVDTFVKPVFWDNILDYRRINSLSLINILAII